MRHLCGSVQSVYPNIGSGRVASVHKGGSEMYRGDAISRGVSIICARIECYQICCPLARTVAPLLDARDLTISQPHRMFAVDSAKSFASTHDAFLFVSSVRLCDSRTASCCIRPTTCAPSCHAARRRLAPSDSTLGKLRCPALRSAAPGE